MVSNNREASLPWPVVQDRAWSDTSSLTISYSIRSTLVLIDRICGTFERLQRRWMDGNPVVGLHVCVSFRVGIKEKNKVTGD